MIRHNNNDKHYWIDQNNDHGMTDGNNSWNNKVTFLGLLPPLTKKLMVKYAPKSFVSVDDTSDTLINDNNKGVDLLR